MIQINCSPARSVGIRCFHPQSRQCYFRETARQLEQSAHQLESLDQYLQADALREMADTLRLDARKLRAEAVSEPRNTVVE
jgi:hypothetical protein